MVTLPKELQMYSERNCLNPDSMIWFDLDNSPHVPLFAPVFRELDIRNIPYDVTARDFAQTLELLKLCGIGHTAIGKHGGKSKIKKILNLIERAGELKKYIKSKFKDKEGIRLAVSHGSRTQLVAAKGLKIRSLLMMDYEYTETRIFNRYADHILVPDLIPASRLSLSGINLKKVIRYSGFKEEMYLGTFNADKNFRAKLGIGEDTVMVIIRPPGMLGNYHDKKSEALLIDAIKHFASAENCAMIITSRSKKDRDFINKNVKDKDKLRFLEKAVDGLQLVSAADIVLSGGGTMNRESALIGTKTYSIFTAKRPYLDEHLESLGRLAFINNKEDIEHIKVERKREKVPYSYNLNIVNEVTDIIVHLAGNNE